MVVPRGIQAVKAVVEQAEAQLHVQPGKDGEEQKMQGCDGGGEDEKAYQDALIYSRQSACVPGIPGPVLAAAACERGPHSEDQSISLEP